MRTTAIPLLALLVWTAVSVPVEGTEYTYVNNLSSKPIRATTHYNFSGNSQFIDRLIEPNTCQSDQYANADCEFGGVGHAPSKITLEVWVDGSSIHGNVNVHCDQSVVAFDTADRTGVDIFFSVRGELNTPDGGVQATIH